MKIWSKIRSFFGRKKHDPKKIEHNTDNIKLLPSPPPKLLPEFSSLPKYTLPVKRVFLLPYTEPQVLSETEQHNKELEMKIEEKTRINSGTEFVILQTKSRKKQ